MKRIFIMLIVTLLLVDLFAEEAANLIIRDEAYKHFTDRNTRVTRVEIFTGNNFLINKIRRTRESSMDEMHEIEISSSGSIIHWIDEEPLVERTTVQIALEEKSFIIETTWENLSKPEKKIKTKKKVTLRGTNGLLWEDNEMLVYLDPDGTYREVAKKLDSKYEYPPSYFTIASDEMVQWHYNQINYRVVFSREGDIVMTKHLQDSYGESVWEDLGWSSIEGPGMRSDDPMVTAINAYILKEFFYLPVYLPHLLGLKAGTLRK